MPRIPCFVSRTSCLDKARNFNQKSSKQKKTPRHRDTRSVYETRSTSKPNFCMPPGSHSKLQSCCVLLEPNPSPSWSETCQNPEIERCQLCGPPGLAACPPDWLWYLSAACAQSLFQSGHVGQIWQVLFFQVLDSCTFTVSRRTLKIPWMKNQILLQSACISL